MGVDEVRILEDMKRRENTEQEIRTKYERRKMIWTEGVDIQVYIERNLEVRRRFVRRKETVKSQPFY